MYVCVVILFFSYFDCCSLFCNMCMQIYISLRQYIYIYIYIYILTQSYSSTCSCQHINTRIENKLPTNGIHYVAFDRSRTTVTHYNTVVRIKTNPILK